MILINKNRIIFIFLLILFIIIILLFYINSKNYSCIFLYTDINKKNLFFENRKIIRGKDKLSTIKNLIDEYLLGPINPNLINLFSKNSKLLSIFIEKDILILNFNRDILFDTNWEKKGENSIYYLQIISIVNTISLNFKDIKKIKFFFDGKEYNFIDNFGPIKDGITPDWKILK